MSPALAHRLPAPVFHSLDVVWGGGRGSARPYAIAAFHRIADLPGDELSYPPAAFAALARYWSDHVEVLPLHRLLARLARGAAADHPSLVITFDDGYADNFEAAAPVLDRLGLSATFFVTTGVLGTAHRFPWDAHLASTPPLMDWGQVRALHAAGFGIGSHTATHARLSRVRGRELAAELETSRARIEMELGLERGHPPLDFAYPFGGGADCDAEARAAARAAGYRSCLSCHGGLVAPTDSPFHLRRIAVSPRWHARPRDWARAMVGARWRHAALAPSHW